MHWSSDTVGGLLEVVAVMPRGKPWLKVPWVKRLSDTLTYRGLASEAVFIVPPSGPCLTALVRPMSEGYERRRVAV